MVFVVVVGIVGVVVGGGVVGVVVGGGAGGGAGGDVVVDVVVGGNVLLSGAEHMATARQHGSVGMCISWRAPVEQRAHQLMLRAFRGVSWRSWSVSML